MEVLILSKTSFGKNVCVGGIVLDNSQYVRLLNQGGWYQYADTDLQIGDVWNIDFTPSDDIIEPHNEDVIINNRTFSRRIDNISEYIQDLNVPIWRGSINLLFEAKLSWTKAGAGYLSKSATSFPANSVGFWINDKPLHYDNNDHYIYYPTSNRIIRRKLKYKGLPAPLETIPANTLLRVSLPKWWKPEDANIEERCYLQLSGWYD